MAKSDDEQNSESKVLDLYRQNDIDSLISFHFQKDSIFTQYEYPHLDLMYVYECVSFAMGSFVSDQGIPYQEIV